MIRHSAYRTVHVWGFRMEIIYYAETPSGIATALAERFFGTAKQEEICVVGSYPDEHSARHEIGAYMSFYNTVRLHQALWNFTPAHVHEVNNSALIIEELNSLKKRVWQEGKARWEGRNA